MDSQSSQNTLFGEIHRRMKSLTGSQTPQKVLLAVSGGEDSMVMLDVFHRLQQDELVSIVVGHVDHHLRAESSEDARFVRKQCAQLGIHCLIREIFPPQTLYQGEEAWARKHRYQLLDSLRKASGAEWIVTAHHAHDQAETVLMRLQTGSGWNSLQGIRDRRNHIVRPFLNVPKDEMSAYAEKNHIPFCVDASNRDQRHPRNFLRQEILPAWIEYEPGLVDNLSEVSRISGDWVAVRKHALDQVVSSMEIVDNVTGIMRIDLKVLHAVPVLTQMDVVRFFMGYRLEDYWPRPMWNKLRNFVQNAQTGSLVSLPAQWTALMDRDAILLKQGNIQQDSEKRLLPNSTVELPPFSVGLHTIKSTKSFNSDPLNETIDAEAIDGNSLLVRHWQNGDRLQPLGMNGTRKVSDILVDAKVDRFAKRNQLVVADRKGIVWVCGHRISHRVRVTSQTQHLAELSLQANVGSS